jgi:hypothetical protein
MNYEVTKSKLKQATLLDIPSNLSMWITKSGNVYYERYGSIFEKRYSLSRDENSTPQYSITIFDKGKKRVAVFGIGRLLMIAYHGLKWDDWSVQCGRKNFDKPFSSRNVKLYSKQTLGQTIFKKRGQSEKFTRKSMSQKKILSYRKRFAKGDISKKKMSEIYNVPYMTMNDLLNKKTYS